MNEKSILEKIKNVRKNSKKRNFTQTFDLIFNLKNFDLKNPSNKIDLGVVLDSNIKPKKLKICAIVDQSITDTDKVFDKVLYQDELMKLKGDMNLVREITHKYDKFVVQVNLMPQFAQVLGRYLGPMNKMPSPKLGMIITPKSDLKSLCEKIQKTVHLQTKKNLVLQVSIGSENLEDSEIAKNVLSVYNALVGSLSNGVFNIKNVKLKLTMSKGEEL